MMVQRLGLLSTLSLTIWCAAGTVAAKPRLRVRVERVIDARFPGYRLSNSEDYQAQYRATFRDGRAGPVIEGEFDYDGFTDFAAVLVATERAPAPAQLGNVKVVVCFGRSGAGFECTERSAGGPVPLDGYLSKPQPVSTTVLNRTAIARSRQRSIRSGGLRTRSLHGSTY